MPEPREIESFGWHPSLPDARDEQYRFTLAAPVPMPRFVDHHSKCPPIWSQGRLGSCTAHAVSRAFSYDLNVQQHNPEFMPSRLMAYYNARALESSTQYDAGASVRDAVKGLVTWGVAPESMWPYNVAKFKEKPSDLAYSEGFHHQVVEYNALSQSVYALKQCLAAGFVFVFGFTVYDSFSEAGETGLMPAPAGRVRGGHAVCCVGYNSHNLFCIANSWGTGWGDKDMPGHFWMPPEYISNPRIATDFWVIKSIET